MCSRSSVTTRTPCSKKGSPGPPTLTYRPPLKRPGDRHYAEYRAIDPDGNNFDISENGYEQIRPTASKADVI